MPPQSRKHSEPPALPSRDCTFRSLGKWHTRMFEKFGWLALAKARGDGHVLTHFKHGLAALMEATAASERSTADADRRRDLAIMAAEQQVLKASFLQLFG